MPYIFFCGEPHFTFEEFLVDGSINQSLSTLIEPVREICAVIFRDIDLGFAFLPRILSKLDDFIDSLLAMARYLASLCSA